eukprot:m.77630 g.77630  ORF g.77630 m.77630 type:complete len:707 (+) comp14477_c0_seq1:115-2235(+)
MAEDSLESYPVTEGEYETVYQIGDGSTAKVFSMMVKATKKRVAVKKIDLEKMSTDLADIQNELVVMKSFEHDNLVKYYQSFVVKSDLWIVLELMDCGSMLDVLRFKEKTAPRGGILSEVVVATVLKGVVSGLNHLHRNMQIHRDVKAGNILLNRNGEVKLGDFGVSAFLGDSITAAMERGAAQEVSRRSKVDPDAFTRSTFVGTPCWMAPEVLTQVSGYNQKADIWSLGITAIELATGVAPYAADDPLEVMKKIIDKPAPTLDTVAVQTMQTYSGYKSLSKFIKKCLEKDTTTRPSAAELLKTNLIHKVAKDAAFLKTELISTLPADFVHHVETADSPQGQGKSRFAISRWSFDENDLGRDNSAAPAVDSIKEVPTPTKPEEPPANSGDPAPGSASPRTRAKSMPNKSHEGHAHVPPLSRSTDGVEVEQPLPALPARHYQLKLLLFKSSTPTPQRQEISFPVDTSQDKAMRIAEELFDNKLISYAHSFNVGKAIGRLLDFPDKRSITFSLDDENDYEVTREGQAPQPHQGQVSITRIADPSPTPIPSATVTRQNTVDSAVCSEYDPTMAEVPVASAGHVADMPLASVPAQHVEGLAPSSVASVPSQPASLGQETRASPSVQAQQQRLEAQSTPVQVQQAAPAPGQVQQVAPAPAQVQAAPGQVQQVAPAQAASGQAQAAPILAQAAPLAEDQSAQSAEAKRTSSLV